jgi:hypothetical protein
MSVSKIRYQESMKYELGHVDAGDEIGIGQPYLM